MKSKTVKPKVALKKKATSPKAPKNQKGDISRVGLYNLKPPRGAHKRNKLKGRGPGSGHGKTSTRGSKGQTSRAGRATYPGFEGGQMPLIRKIPKRGFSSANRKEYQVVNIESLSKIKEDKITPELLQSKGLIKDKNKPVKILGDGELKSAIAVSAHAFSGRAQEKIKLAGGSFETINA